MFTISKRFDFSASHVLNGLPEGHQCGRLHGHNYAVEAVLADDTLGAEGFVVDYGELRTVKDLVDALDHRHLNNVLDFNPTAELLARWIFDQLITTHPQLIAVRVSETPKTWAEYRP